MDFETFRFFLENRELCPPNVLALLYVSAFVFGAILGSFANACIYRIPKNLSMLFLRSKCPKCGHELGALDLFPVFSYLFLRARCRHCGKKISTQYILVEIVLGGFFLLNFHLFGYGFNFLAGSVFAVFLVIIAFIDLETMIIYDRLSIGGILAGFGLSFINVPSAGLFDLTGNVVSPFNSIVGIIAGGGIIYLVAMVGQLVFKKESMGGGDVKLAGMMGAFLGWKTGILAVMLGFVAGAVVGVVLLLGRNIKLGQQIPFGPYLAIGGLISFYVGDIIIGLWLTSIIR